MTTRPRFDTGPEPDSHGYGQTDACTAPEEDHHTYQHMLTTGVSARQLHYWTAAGWLHADPRAGHGSGNHRRWCPGELEVCSRGVLLVMLGFTAEAALRYARDGRVLLELGSTVVLDMPAREAR